MANSKTVLHSSTPDKFEPAQEYQVQLVVNYYCCCIIIVLLAALAPSSLVAQDDATKKVIQTASAGYQANLDAFEHFTCEYTVTFGFANSIEDAAKGKFEPGARTAMATVVKNGKSICYRIQADGESINDRNLPPQEIPEMGIPGVKFGVGVPFVTTDYLNNGKRALRIDGEHGNIFDSNASNDMNPNSIWEIFRWHGSNEVARLKDAKDGGVAIKSAAITGEKNPRIQIEYSRKATKIVNVTIDPTKGYLPVLIQETDLKDTHTATLAIPKVIACSKKRWFPEQIVTFLDQKIPGQKAGLVRVFNVTKFDADKRPPAERLTLEVPAGTNICQFGHPANYYKTKQDEKITPADLDRVHKLTEQALQP